LQLASLIIDLPDEQRATLSAKARARGLSLEQYAREVLERDLAPEWLRKSWETAQQIGLDRLTNEEIEAEIAAARRDRYSARSQPGS
jgi:plasmid stability protein